jgi:hypothetical protein
MDEFDQLTMNKQLQRYIALLDGRIKFFDIPNCPHGELIGHLTFAIGNQLGIGSRDPRFDARIWIRQWYVPL